MCSFYQTRIMPYVIHGGCSMPAFTRMRERVLPKARGLVAEIGFGSGLNLPYYDSAKVDRLIGIDPDPSMLGIARKRLAGIRLQVQLIEGRAEELSLPDSSMDTAVVTYALCTIPNPQSALREIRRILKPGGRLLFIEHGRSATPWRHRWQDRLNGRVGSHRRRLPSQPQSGAAHRGCRLHGRREAAGAFPVAPMAARHPVWRRGIASVTVEGGSGSVLLPWVWLSTSELAGATRAVAVPSNADVI